MKKPSKQQLEKQLNWLRQYIEVGSVEEMLKIKKLDLSHKGIKGEVDLYMPALKLFSISNNQLTSFTGEYPVLERLYIFNNQLTDISNIPKIDLIAFYNNIYIPYSLLEKLFNKTITFKEIMMIKNSEHRMTALMVYSPDKLLKESKAKLIHKSFKKSKKGNWLYEVKGLCDEAVKMVRYFCPSTNREYIDYVLPRISNADEAMAFKLSLTIDEYYSMAWET